MNPALPLELRPMVGPALLASPSSRKGDPPAREEDRASSSGGADPRSHPIHAELDRLRRELTRFVGELEDTIGRVPHASVRSVRLARDCMHAGRYLLAAVEALRSAYLLGAEADRLAQDLTPFPSPKDRP